MAATKIKPMPFKDSDGWTITNNRFVAYIDIMGFKDMVAREEHDNIYSMMKEIIESKDFNEETWSSGDAKDIRITTYSDSIMIYSKDDTPNSLESLVYSVSSLSDDLFRQKIPHKGAIAYGKMTLDTKKSIFFGQPLIDAFLLQEELSFYGIISHASAEQRIDTLKNENVSDVLKQYLYPFKNGSSNHLAIIPLSFFLSEDEKKLLINFVKDLRYRTSGYLRKYIDNTLSYLETLKVNN